MGVIWIALLLFSWSDSSSSEIKWRKELGAQVDGRTVDCSFVGGMEYAKPSFADIDGDGKLDLLIGDLNGTIRFFRNAGTPQEPKWNLFSDFRDSTIGERSSPVLVDIDADGDQDLFVGNQEGKICFFRNDGNKYSPVWIRVTDYYASIDVGTESVPTFVDIDDDKDLDLFVGRGDGAISYYQNNGTKNTPLWNLVTEKYDSIDVGSSSTPFFVDLDADGDMDMLVGEDQGNINFYRNTGNKAVPIWNLVSDHYNSIDAGKRSAPALYDIDADSDLDLLIGQDQGKTLFYRNDGSIYLPSWTEVTEDYLFMDVGSNSRPVLADIDGDGDMDLFAGEVEGNVNYFRNEATGPISSWSTITENYFAIQAGDYSAPAFADIDQDGDLDLFIGKKDGTIDFYQNIGTAGSAVWILASSQYNSMDVGSYAAPAFVDIDHDSDLDIFIGHMQGKLVFYRNDGTPQVPLWNLASENFDSIDVGWYSAPTFGDLDLDGDYDLLIGNGDGRVFFYQNDGTPQAYSFTYISDFYNSIDVGDRATPMLGDFDSDGDWDLLLGESEGGLHFYRNLTLNRIKGKVTDEADKPLMNAVVHLIGLKSNSTFTDSSGSYEFVGLPVGDYCVFRAQGSFKYCFAPLDSDTYEVNFVGTTEVEEPSGQCSPNHFQLFPNYPNPFNPSTNICYFLPQEAKVTLIIYNLKGEQVKVLADGFQTKGEKRTIWDGKDSQGNQVASGVYLCKLQTGNWSKSIKMLLLK